ncbi:MAG: PspA/IM30 family protein, partial [Planctomycetota bacterium]|nr:PspA/IM30 family protein [Planctomycetota bacterium]
MGIFGRIVDVISANLNDLVDRAENPEKMLKQIIREIEESIDKCKQEMAKVLAEARHLDKEVDAKVKEVEEWQKRAELAVDQSNDDLARKAIERKLTHAKE